MNKGIRDVYQFFLENKNPGAKIQDKYLHLTYSRKDSWTNWGYWVDNVTPCFQYYLYKYATNRKD